MKKIIYILIVLLSIPIMTSCANQNKSLAEVKKESAPEVVSKYYKAIIEGDYANAYNYLSLGSKAEYPLAVFIEYKEIQRTGFALVDFTIVNELGSDSNKTFELEFKCKSASSDTSDLHPHIATVISENNEYKVDLGDVFKSFTSFACVELASNNLFSHDKDFDYVAYLSTKAIELDPKSTFAYYNLAIAYSFTSIIDDALDIIEQYIILSSSLPENKYVLSRMYELKGLNMLGKHNGEKAKESYKKAYDIDPNNKDALESYLAL